jgi:hypothetical protein
MDPPAPIEIDLQAVERLRRDIARPTPAALRNAITLTLVEVFSKALDRGRILTPPQMVRAMARRVREIRGFQPGEDPPPPATPRQLALHFEAIRHAYCMAARIYVDYFSDHYPEAKTATKGRHRSIDANRDLLLRPDLSHLEKAKRLGLPTTTPEDKRRAKDIVRKRMDAVKKRR